MSAATYQLRCCNPTEVPPRPWVKIGVDFFQDHLGKKHLIVADYFSKFPYVFPVASTHHFKTITHLRNSLQLKAYPLSSCLTMDLLSTEKNSGSFPMTLTSWHTTSSPHFHQLNGFIEAMVKKVKNAYKKMDGSPMLRLEHYSNYMTHLSRQTSHPQQRFYMVV